MGKLSELQEKIADCLKELEFTEEEWKMFNDFLAMPSDRQEKIISVVNQIEQANCDTMPTVAGK